MTFSLIRTAYKNEVFYSIQIPIEGLLFYSIQIPIEGLARVKKKKKKTQKDIKFLSRELREKM